MEDTKMPIATTPVKKRREKSSQHEQDESRQEFEEMNYDEEVVNILRAASEAEPIMPPQDTEEFFKFLHKKA
jgi:anaerobic ribonucleoside-triphosphate reductase